MSLIGWFGSVILAFSSLPQMIKVVREGNAHGLSPTFLLAWLIGEILCLIYVLPSGNWPLIANYSVNLLILLVIGYYKIFPRLSPNLIHTRSLTPAERRAIIKQIN